jgi:hypothetical protein
MPSSQDPPRRALTDSERFIFQQIQDMDGGQNSEKDVFSQIWTRRFFS